MSDIIELSPLPTEVDYAWAGGFFEGEGCISSQKKGPTHRSNYYELIIGNTDLEPLNKFENIFGGTLRLKKSDSRFKAVYVWRSESQEHAREVMRRIYPYLSERRQEAWSNALERRKQWEEGIE